MSFWLSSPSQLLKRARGHSAAGGEPVAVGANAVPELEEANGTGPSGTGPSGTGPSRAEPSREDPSGRGPTLSAELVPAQRLHERGRPAWQEVGAVLVIALGLAMALYHNATLAPLGVQVGGAGDADEYSWFLSWMPFALGHGLNPLISHYLNAPGGINLMWNTSIILPSLLMSPITLIFGAAFSYNVLVIFGLALCVAASYLAFRRWTGRLPALAGSLIVAFSPYMVSQSAGHLAQILIMSAPLLLIMLDRLLVVQSGRAWLDGLLLGVLAWAQLLTGEEVLAMEAVAAAIGVAVLCAISWREITQHLRYAARGSAAALGSFILLAAPFLAVQYLGPDRVQDVHPANAYVSDLFNFFVPTNITKLAPAAALHVSAHFTGNGSEEGAYIGVPLLVFIVLTLVLARRRRVTWVALGVAAGAGIMSMGPTLHRAGHVTRHHLPDYYLQKLPIFHNLLPDRFASMMVVGVGLLVALGCNELKRVIKPAMALGWAIVAVGLVALFPITNFPAAASPIYSAFATGLSCPPARARASLGHVPIALFLPTKNEMNLRWQAESKFCYVMPTATGMTGTNSGDVSFSGLLMVGDEYTPFSTMTGAVRATAAAQIQQLHVSEIAVAPESPASPLWAPQGQAQAVVWVEWLLGQAPLQSKGPYISYYWKDLPPVADIAAGHVPRMPGLPPP